MTSIQIALLVGLIIFIIWLIWNNSRTIDGLDRDLLAATNGNKELARRLLIQARAKYPGKSEKWYAEKALYDLNRDRAVVKSDRSKFSVISYTDNLTVARRSSHFSNSTAQKTTLLKTRLRAKSIADIATVAKSFSKKGM